MNSNELMLGNYVKFSESSPCYQSFGDKPYKILTLLEQGVVSLQINDEISFWTTEEDIEPVPLTPEIMEKIGLVDIMYDKCMYIDKNGVPYNLKYFNVKYLHELQQVFTLCKIEKTIEL